MLYVADVIHTARECPGIDSENFKQFIKMVSKENLANLGIEFVAAYVDRACLTGLLGRDHTTSIVVDSNSQERVERAFRNLRVEIRDVLPWKEVARP
jgi:hypothetical protein